MFIEFVTYKEYAEALAESRKAQALAPNSVDANALLGDILMSLKRPAEAQPFYERALQLAKTIEPEFQVRQIPRLEAMLGRVNGSPNP